MITHRILRSIRVLPAACLAALACCCAAHAAEQQPAASEQSPSPSSGASPSPAPSPSAAAPAPSPLAQYPPAPQYPVPYDIPKPDSIKAALDCIRQRLESAVVLRFVDAQTREPITDLSKPNPNAVLDRGLEWKFAPLDYPMGVVHAGMLLASEVTGDKRFADFTAKHFQFIADTIPTFKGWGEKDFAPRNAFRYMLKPENLDACGAMGAAMIKARRANIGPDMKEVIDRAAAFISKGQFRLEDGTFARKSPRPICMWADDFYMSVPFLGQMGKLTGETSYYDDAAKQVVQFGSHLFIPSEGLFTHGWNAANTEHHGKYFWGRANGWCFMAMVELLEVLPEDHPRREEVLKLLRAHAEGLANHQSGSGLWHQVLDRNDSYLETSASAMFTYALARAVNRGWIDAFSYGPVAVTAWNALSARVTFDGRIEGTCIGTAYASDYPYYYNRPATDDVHGYGPMLLAGAEMIRLVQNEKLFLRAGWNSPMHIDQKKK